MQFLRAALLRSARGEAAADALDDFSRKDGLNWDAHQATPEFHI